MYKKGSENIIADALSRKPQDTSAGELYGISTIHTELLSDIQHSWECDSEIQQRISQLKDGKQVKHYSWQQQVLCRKGRIVVGPDLNLQTKLIMMWHNDPMGGHSGVEVTYQKLKQTFYWKKMHSLVTSVVASCDVCQRSKPDNAAYPGLLQPLPIPTTVWSEVSMDFIEGLPNSHSKSLILVVVDRLSKYAHFIALSHPYTAITVAQVFLDFIYRLHGMPTTIVSDRDAVFMSQF